MFSDIFQRFLNIAAFFPLYSVDMVYLLYMQFLYSVDMQLVNELRLVMLACVLAHITHNMSSASWRTADVRPVRLFIHIHIFTSGLKFASVSV